MLIKTRDLVILVVYCGLIFQASAQPTLPIDMNLFLHQDKLVHMMAYGVMGSLCWRALRHFIHQQPLLTWCCIGFCGLYGLSDEIHQSYIPGRCADAMDLVADIIGAVISTALHSKYRTNSVC